MASVIIEAGYDNLETINGSNVTEIIVVSVKGVCLNQQSVTLNQGQSVQLVATIEPINAANKSLSWSSNSVNVSVNQSGLVTAISPGVANITVRASGNITAMCIITVNAPPASLRISPTTLALLVGGYSTISAAVVPSNSVILWSSANSDVASVNSLGSVTGVGNGNTLITAAVPIHGIMATSSVSVTTSVTGVSLNSSSINLIIGGSFQAVATVAPSTASNKIVSWSSNSPGVASVNDSGLITAVGNGSAIIKVTTQDGSKVASLFVNIVTYVRGVSLNDSSLSIRVGMPKVLFATITPANATNRAVIWSSANPAIVRVSSLGVVKGLAPGSSLITVTTVDRGYKATCVVTVT